MAMIIVCDGGCGAQSPNPRTGLHDANSWLIVRAIRSRALFDRAYPGDDQRFCAACAPRVLEALEPLPDGDGRGG